MPSDKRILDIRYFESDVPNVDGADPDYVGKHLSLPKFCDLVGARIARKLREFGFTTGKFNHVYINFSSAVRPEEISFAPRSGDRYHPSYRFVDVGVEAAQINKLSAKKKRAWLESVTLQVASFLAGKSKQQHARIDQ